MQNRLWCCSSENNEIYCCKQGDERNWQAYSDGISTDSWAMTCGKEGKFTGIATRGDSVIFFKENYALKIYGTKPSNFTLAEYNVPGVEIGSEKALSTLTQPYFILAITVYMLIRAVACRLSSAKNLFGVILIRTQSAVGTEISIISPQKETTENRNFLCTIQTKACGTRKTTQR